MSRIFSHPPYAEDQPFSRTILHTHVQLRAIPTGAFIGNLVNTIRASRLAGRPALPALPFLLRGAGTSAAITAGVLALGTEARMWGREEIEWQDRSWRLLENRSQVGEDDWAVLGLVGGLIAYGSGKRRLLAGWNVTGLGWRGWLGAAGMGSIASLGFWGVWRDGVFGFKVGKEGD